MQSLIHSVRALSLQSVQLKPVLLQQQYQLPCVVQVVHMSFYKSETADTLWKTMTGVSQQGKKRGRARNLLRPKNLNRGQMYGFGKKKIDFPGLSSKVLSGSGADVRTKNIEEMRYFINLNSNIVSESNAFYYSLAWKPSVTHVPHMLRISKQS